MAESNKRRFVWGWGRLPQHCKSHPTNASVPKPKLLDALESSSLSHLLVGNGVVAVTHSGDMYAWGASGQVPPQINPSSCSVCQGLQQFASPPFALVHPIDGQVVSHASLTSEQCVAATENGSVYRWTFEREKLFSLNPNNEISSSTASSSNSTLSSSISDRLSTPSNSSPQKSDSNLAFPKSPSASSLFSIPEVEASSSSSSSEPPHSEMDSSDASSLSLPTAPLTGSSISSGASTLTRKYKTPPPPPPLPSSLSEDPPPPPPSPPAPPSPTSCGMDPACSSSSSSQSSAPESFSFTALSLVPLSVSCSSSSEAPLLSPSSASQGAFPSMAAILSRLDSSVDISKASLCLQNRSSALGEYKCSQVMLVDGVPLMQQVVGMGRDNLFLGKDGQLYRSTNNLPIVSIPTSLVTGDKVISIACGFSHALAITAQGCVLSWGQGEGGRLGHGDELPRTEPTKIGRLDYAQIVEVACGYHHSLARSSAGRVHVWGGNQFGQLGCGDKSQKLSPIKLDPLPNPEQDVQNKVVSLSAGAFHTGFVTSRGELFTCGWGEYGQLGLGDDNNRSTPTAVGALRGMDVSMVACAGRYTVCVTEYFIKINVNHFASETDGGPATFVSPPFIANHEPAPTPTSATVPSKAPSDQPSSPAKVPSPLSSKFSSASPTPSFSSSAAASSTTTQQHDLFFKLIRGLVPPADEALPLRIHMPAIAHPSADFTLPPFVDVQKPNDGALSQSYRPTHFPAKTAEEVKKHAAEAEKMNARYQKKLEIRDKESITKNFFSADAAASSRARADKDAKKKLAREKAMDVHTKEWLKKVLPNWGTQTILMKAQKLCMKLGIPPSIRPTLWPRLVGNILQIDEASYRAFAQSAATARSRWEKERIVQEGKDSTFMDIDVDLARTFPQLSFFKSHGAHHVQLQTLLDTYCLYRPDLGYVQGMSYLAGILLLYMPSYEAFTCFANLLHRPYAHAFLKLNMEKMNARYKLHQTLLREHHPDLADWLDGQGLLPEMYLMDWFIALFCKSLPIELVGRVWDGYLLFGESFVYRTSAAICAVLKPHLLNQPLDVCLKVLKSESQSLDEDVLFENIAKIKLSEKDIAKLEAAERAQEKAEFTLVTHIANHEMDDFVSSSAVQVEPSLPFSGSRMSVSGESKLSSARDTHTRNKSPPYKDFLSPLVELNSASSSSSSSSLSFSSSSSSSSAASTKPRSLSSTHREGEGGTHTQILLRELEAKKAELLQNQEFMSRRVGALKVALTNSMETDDVDAYLGETAAAAQYLDSLSDAAIARLEMREAAAASASSSRRSSISPHHGNTSSSSIPRSSSFSSNSTSASFLSREPLGSRSQSTHAPYVPPLARDDHLPYVPSHSRNDRSLVSTSSTLPPVASVVEHVRTLVGSASELKEPRRTRTDSMYLREGARFEEEFPRSQSLRDESPRALSRVGMNGSSVLSTEEQLQYERDQAHVLRLRLQYEELQRKQERDGLTPSSSLQYDMSSTYLSTKTEHEEPVTISALAAKISSILKPT